MASLHKAVAQMQSFPKSDDFAVLLGQSPWNNVVGPESPDTG